MILVTLVGQGLSLPWLIRKLGVASDGDGAEQEHRTRAAATEAATLRIEELAAEWPDHLPLIESLRVQYAHRSGHLAEIAALVDGGGDANAAEQEILEHRAIRRAVIDAERAVVLELLDRGEITNEIGRRLERDLDLEELRMEA